MTKTAMKRASWSDLKRSLTELDCNDLLGVIQSLYAASKENKAFLHARFDLDGDILDPYKKTIERWLWPDVIYKNQSYSVAKGKKAIADYKKAAGRAVEMADLQVFFCEQAVGFCNQVGLHDEGCHNALVGMFEQAMNTIDTLDPGVQGHFITRLEQVVSRGQDVGWGFGDHMDLMLQDWYGDGADE